jgi:hypothetical protein
MAMGEVKAEHWDGRIFGDADVRDRVLSALLANAGLRRALSLAPRSVWEQSIRRRAATVAWQRAVAADRAAGTHNARYESPPTPTPVVRPEFVTAEDDAEWSWSWHRRELVQPFYVWEKGTEGAAAGKPQGMRMLEIGYIQLGELTLSRTDVLGLNRPWHSRDGWPKPEAAALVVHAAESEGTLLFDWEVRRPAYLEAGVDEVWIIDIDGQRIFRERRGEGSTTVSYTDVHDSITWHDANGAKVVVDLVLLFGKVPKPASEHRIHPEGFASFQEHELARLQQFETPWTVGHRPQWFEVSIAQLVGRFKDELWDGVLFGAEYQRDEILSALLANVGVEEVLRLAPIELWQKALGQAA